MKFYDFSTEKEFSKYCNAETKEERALHKARFISMLKEDVEGRLEATEKENTKCKCKECKCGK